MTYNSSTKKFTRGMRFETDVDTEDGDAMRQVDFDRAFDDVVSGMNAVARDAASYKDKATMLASGIDYNLYSSGDVIRAGGLTFQVVEASASNYHEITVSGDSGDGGLRMVEAGVMFSTAVKAGQGFTLGANSIIVEGIPYVYDAAGTDLTTADGRTWTKVSDTFDVDFGALTGTPGDDAKRVQIRRGTALEHETFTGALGELTFNTSRNSLHVHDGSKSGGFEGGGFKGTWASAIAPVIRAVQAKLEDWLSVKDFGAVGDGTTDDTDAIQNAINTALLEGGREIFFPAGTYYCAGDLYFCYDATNNTSAPSDNLKSGRLIVLGAGIMSRRDYERDHFAGSVIKFASGKKATFSQNGAARSWKKTVQDICFVGNNGTIISDTYAASQTTYRRVFVGTEGAQADTPIFHVSDNYISTFDTIEIVGDKTLTSGRVGWGFWAEPSDTAGGGNIYQNITGAYCDKGVIIGQPYDGTETGVTDNSKANTMIACQGHYANVGIHVMQNTNSLTMIGCWAENCDVAPIKVSDSAANIEIVSCNGSFASGQTGDRGVVTIGDDTGTAGVDLAKNVIVRNSRFFCTAGVAGVYLYDAAQDVLVNNNSFHNAGGAAVGLEGGVGGEVTLTDNDYFPTTAASAIANAREVCSISGTYSSPTYTDLRHYALEHDKAVPSLAADLDCSSWRKPPKLVILNTLSADRTLTLPDLSGAGGRKAFCKVIKPYAANDVIVDAQSGNAIKGSQTATVEKAYESLTLLHAGSGSTRWDVLGQSSGSVLISQSAPSDPTGGSTIDAEARAAIDTIIDKLQSAGVFT